jgi:hypothetical protein
MQVALTLSLLVGALPASSHVTVKDLTASKRCATREALLAQVDAQVSDRAPSPSREEMYEVTFSNEPVDAGENNPEKPQRWRAVITGRNGTRDLEDFALTCDALSSAVAVSLSILLNSTGLKAVETATLNSIGISLGLGGAAPMLAAFSPSLSLTGELVLGPRVAVSAGGLVFLPTVLAVSPGEIRLFSAAGLVRAGYRFRPAGSIVLTPSVALLTGVVDGQGMGYPANRQVAQLWLAADFDVMLELALSQRVGLYVRAGVWLSLRRPAFDVSGIGTVFQWPVMSGFFEIGPNVRW